MANIHLMLQKKGGVGKSTLCCFFAEYMLYKGRTLRCYDTDVSVGKFSSFTAFNVQKVNIFDEQKRIDPIQFDGLMEELLAAGDDEEIIIDTGGDSYTALNSYIIENDVFSLLSEHGHRVFWHTVLLGGADYEITTSDFSNLASNFSVFDGVSFVIWLNPFNGKKVAFNKINFEDSDLFKAAKKTGKVFALIDLPVTDPLTFGHNIGTMLENKQSFAEAIDDSKRFNIMARSRLTKMRKSTFALIDMCNL